MVFLIVDSSSRRIKFPMAISHLAFILLMPHILSFATQTWECRTYRKTLHRPAHHLEGQGLGWQGSQGWGLKKSGCLHSVVRWSVWIVGQKQELCFLMEITSCGSRGQGWKWVVWTLWFACSWGHTVSLLRPKFWFLSCKPAKGDHKCFVIRDFCMHHSLWEDLWGPALVGSYSHTS